MAEYYPEQTYILPLTTILRERRLPRKGEILVRLGQSVAAVDVVARTTIPSRHEIVDVAELLGLLPEKADEYIIPGEEDSVEEGDRLAERKGTISTRVIRAPSSGRVLLRENGRLVLEVDLREYELKASIPGEISDVMGSYGVQIEAVGALIQCVWGSGGLEFGMLEVLEPDEDGVVTPESIDMSFDGAIVALHGELTAELIDAAVKNRVRGLIAAGMRASLIGKAKKSGLPIVLTEGFGFRRMNEAAMKLLDDNRKRQITLDACEPEPWEGKRPEIFIPLPSPGERPEAPPMGVPLEVGSRVRLLRAPLTGMVGTVVGMPQEPRRLDNGLSVYGAEVELPSKRVVFVPLSNLELIR